MVESLQTVSALTWLVLSVIVFIRLRQWNKRFSELYDALKTQIAEVLQDMEVEE